jgi:methionyl-tRNA formyltransferase
MENDRRGRTCVHVIVPGMDEGDMVLAADYEFPPSARIPRDYQRYSLEQAKPALTTFLASLAKGEPLKRLPQDHSSATYFPRLNTEAQAWIDWSWPGAKIESFILAFSHPYPGAKTALRGETTHIFDARFVPGTGHPFFAGLIVRSGPVVACIDGTIVCDEVQTPMLLRVGDRLVTPEAKLRQALEVRPIYTPKGLKPLFAG